MSAWTRQEQGYALNRVGFARLSTIAKQLGRAERTVRKKIGNTQQLIIKQEGVGIAEVAVALGVNHQTVRNWIARGQITATRRIVEKQWVYTISYDDVTAFLRDKGYALSPIIKPQTYIWRDIVSEIRAELEARLISGRACSEALMCNRKAFGYMRSHLGFPEPHLRLGSRAGGDWYAREDIADWLREHPRYITQAAVEELGLTEEI
jgi:IS30 family transposase